MVTWMLARAAHALRGACAYGSSNAGGAARWCCLLLLVGSGFADVCWLEWFAL